MTTLSTRHRDQMRQLESLNAKMKCVASEGIASYRQTVLSTIAEEIEHTDISTPRREEDDDAMREVEAGTFKRVNAARYGG